MPVIPIPSADTSRDPLVAYILYAYTCYPRDQEKREEVVATFLARACIDKPEAQPILDHAATNFSWFLPALHRASKPDRVLRAAAEQSASAWAIGEMLLIMLGAAMYHPELDVNPTKTVWVITATERGSFIVNLEFWQTVAEHVRALLSPEHIATVDVILTSLLGKATGILGVMKLIKVLKGRRIKRRRVLQSGNVEIELPDGSTAETTEEAIRLYEDRKVREDAAQSVKPLEVEGIDALEVRQGGETVEVVRKEDREAFVAAAEKPDYRTLDPTLQSSAQRAVEIVKPSFADDLVWTVSGGENERFTAKMADVAFQEQIERGEVFFKKGDVAIVEVQTKSWVVDGKVHSEHEITKVHRFDHAGDEQLTISGEPKD